MRMFTLAFLTLLPAAALAQTPKDIARQLWPAGAPDSQNVATSTTADMRGGGTGADLARLARLPATAGLNLPPRADLAPLPGFTVADLVRLRGDSTPAWTLFQSPTAYRTVAR